MLRLGIGWCWCGAAGEAGFYVVGHVFIVEVRHETRLVHEPIRYAFCDGEMLAAVVVVGGELSGVVVGLGIGAEAHAAEAVFARVAGTQGGRDGG